MGLGVKSSPISGGEKCLRSFNVWKQQETIGNEFKRSINIRHAKETEFNRIKQNQTKARGIEGG
jgi:hypothetical protein